MQGAQARRKRLVASRVLTLRAAGRPMPKMDGLDVGRAARQAGILQHARNVAGLARRLLLGRV
jgi:coenzyme F420 hydrogenase subunit beta